MVVKAVNELALLSRTRSRTLFDLRVYEHHVVDSPSAGCAATASRCVARCPKKPRAESESERSFFLIHFMRLRLLGLVQWPGWKPSPMRFELMMGGRLRVGL